MSAATAHSRRHAVSLLLPTGPSFALTMRGRRRLARAVRVRASPVGPAGRRRGQNRVPVRQVACLGRERLSPRCVQGLQRGCDGLHVAQVLVVRAGLREPQREQSFEQDPALVTLHESVISGPEDFRWPRPGRRGPGSVEKSIVPGQRARDREDENGHRPYPKRPRPMQWLQDAWPAGHMACWDAQSRRAVHGVARAGVPGRRRADRAAPPVSGLPPRHGARPVLPVAAGLAGFASFWCLASLIPALDTLVQFVRLRDDAASLPDHVIAVPLEAPRSARPPEARGHRT